MAITLAAISTAFTTAVPLVTVYDDRINDTQLQALITANNTTNGVAFNGYTNAQSIDTIINFTFEAACLHANKNTSIIMDVSPVGAPQVISYNSLRNMLNNAGLPFSHVYTALATDIYNTMRRTNRFPAKHEDFGFTYEHRFMAFPGSNKINKELAHPPIPEEWFMAANLNKFANIQSSLKTSGTQNLTTHHHFLHAGVAPRPNAGLLTQ